MIRTPVLGKNKYFVLLALFASLNSTAQLSQNEFLTLHKLKKESNYLGYLDYSKGAGDLQLISTAQSYMGNYLSALETMNSDSHIQDEISEAVAKKNEAIVSFQEVDSNDFFEELENVDFLLVNESHHIPAHRFYLLQLIPRLAQLNFKYLFLESLNPKDDVNEREFPMVKTCVYSEPIMGLLIRQAIKYGFEILPYDANGFDPQTRERKQAENIISASNANREGKAVVLGGYTHIATEPIGSYRAMGNHLKDHYKVVSLDQTEFEENPDVLLETNLYKTIAYAKEETQLIRFEAQNAIDNYDYYAIHPKNWINEFWNNWLAEHWIRKTLNLATKRPDKLQVQVFLKHEFDLYQTKCLPIFQKDYTREDTITAYTPQAEDCVILIRDVQGNTLMKEVVVN